MNRCTTPTFQYAMKKPKPNVPCSVNGKPHTFTVGQLLNVESQVEKEKDPKKALRLYLALLNETATKYQNEN